ncbi:MAG: family 43 glycosylhydrolase, partial [Planctomycetes bacterium]|nr:family 43 glycosylhydrolase [Planctomycetota bacterium]
MKLTTTLCAGLGFALLIGCTPRRYQPRPIDHALSAPASAVAAGLAPGPTSPAAEPAEPPAATAPSATGPFTDLGRPLVHDPSPGVIDAHYFRASDGRRFLTWKVDGNAIGRPTPIRIQELAEDGVTLRGSPQTILTNDRGWEGALVEGQWMVERDGFFYLFYSANGYAS